MKKCPYCAEEIQDAAIKCKHCGEFLNGAARPQPPAADGLKWYYRTTFILIALAGVGPLALPLIWWHPQMKPAWKVVWTVATLVVTWLAVIATVRLAQNIETMYNQLQAF